MVTSDNLWFPSGSQQSVTSKSCDPPRCLWWWLWGQPRVSACWKVRSHCCCAPGGMDLVPPRSLFSLPALLTPPFLGAAFGGPPKDAPGCFGAEEMELQGMRDTWGIQGRGDRQGERTSMGTCPRGVAQTLTGCTGLKRVPLTSHPPSESRRGWGALWPCSPTAWCAMCAAAGAPQLGLVLSTPTQGTHLSPGDIPGAPCHLPLAPHLANMRGRTKAALGGKDKCSTRSWGHKFYSADRGVNPEANPRFLLQVPWENHGAERLWLMSRGGGEMSGNTRSVGTVTSPPPCPVGTVPSPPPCPVPPAGAMPRTPARCCRGC